MADYKVLPLPLYETSFLGTKEQILVSSAESFLHTVGDFCWRLELQRGLPCS